MTFPIPDAALDDRLGWIGTSGSGKTYNAGKGVERLLSSGARVVIVDPLGVWWGLRLLADGKTASPFNVVIFGGPHGDLPLTEHVGQLIGETAATMGESCIVDLSELGSKAADRRFMAAFLETVFRKANGDPFHLVVDEADLFAPQKPGKGDEVLLGHMENIVRRGRVRGFIPWLISQRPAVLNKNVLSQVDGLIAFMLTASQDRKPLGDWVSAQADEGDWPRIYGTLPTLPIGTGVVWLPRRAMLETVRFPQKITFDSSATPKRGEKRQRRDLKPLDLGKLKERLATVEEETKANDPRALKAEVARLTRELTATKAAQNIPGNIPAPTWPDQRELVAQLTAERDELLGKAEELTASAAELQRRQQAALAALGGESVAIPVAPVRKARVIPAPAPVKRQPAPVREARQSEGVTGPQQRILDALAWWASFGMEQPTSEQVAFVAGYSASSSGYANLKGAMRSAGLIEYPQPGKVALTGEGSALANPPNGEVSREAFHAAVRAKLKGPQLRLLDPLILVWPDSLSSDELATEADYSPSSSGFANLKGNMRTLGFIDYPSPGFARANDWLFP